MNIFKKAKDIKVKYLAKAQEKDAYLVERLQEEAPKRLRKEIYKRITEDTSSRFAVMVNFLDILDAVEKDVRKSLGYSSWDFPATGYSQFDVAEEVAKELGEHFKLKRVSYMGIFEFLITMKEE